MAKALIDNLTEPWNPTAYKDEYREALLEIVEKKIAGEEIEVVPEAAPARVVDLMDALKASVEAAKKKTPTARPKAKTAAKKTAAKKTAAPPKKAATG